jgi:hypothetical protein
MYTLGQQYVMNVTTLCMGERIMHNREGVFGLMHTYLHYSYLHTNANLSLYISPYTPMYLHRD